MLLKMRTLISILTLTAATAVYSASPPGYRADYQRVSSGSLVQDKNFYVLTRYNRSFFYALAVYQLGQRVKAQMEASDAANASSNAAPPGAASQ